MIPQNKNNGAIQVLTCPYFTKMKVQILVTGNADCINLI